MGSDQPSAREQVDAIEQARRQLEHERAQLAAVIQAMDDGVVVFDAAGNVVLVNQAQAAICGYGSPDEMRRDLAYFTTVFELREPGAAAVPVDQWPVSRVLRGEIISNVVHEAHRRDTGLRLTISFSGRPVRDADGALLLAVIISRDITTARRHEDHLLDSERRFRALADNIPQLAWIAEADGWIGWYNQRWFDYTGTDLADMRGWGWQSVHHPDHVARVTEKFRRHVASGEPWEDTFPLRGADGHFRWFLSRAFPIRDDAGRVIRWFGTNTDITAQREAEEALRRSNAELEQFAYVAAHDLREPLRMVSQYLSLALHRFEPGMATDLASYLRSALEGAKRTQQLMDDLLSYSRAGRALDPPAPVDVYEVVAQVREVLADEIARSGAIIAIGPLPRLRFEKTKLVQVFQNLIGNALKFRLPDTPPRISVGASRRGEDWEFVVADNGIGIDPIYAQRIFDVFQRLHARGEYPGTGIGLAICKRIIEQAGGRIAVASATGQGSTFRFTLPATLAVE